MSAKIIDGKQLSAGLKTKLKQDVADFTREKGLPPGLAVIRVGEDPASKVYVRNKRKMCEELGMRSWEENPDASISEEGVLKLLDNFNRNNEVHGILVQLPLPNHIQTKKVLQAIDPGKDADGFHPVNLGKLLAGEPENVPCTPAGIAYMLDASGIEVEGKTVVIVGRSLTVGKPLANLMLLKKKNRNATVIVCHSRTKELAVYTRQAQILVAAIGRPQMITRDMVQNGVVVIDVGINRVGEKVSQKTGKKISILKGDVDFDGVKEIASHITPVPGGVGPMTVTFLMQNTLNAARKLTE